MSQSIPKSKIFHLGTKRPKIGMIGLLLVLIFLFQFAVLCYFNLTQIRNHVGDDSSWNLLRATLMWNDKALFNPSWNESTTTHLDTTMLIASLLYGMTGNIMLSFGIADMVVVIALLLFVWKILERLDAGFNAKMIALNLIICPYLTTEYVAFNDLGYFSCVLSGASYYSIRALFVLMIIFEFLEITQDQKIGVCGWLLFPACLISGISAGVYLIVVMFIPYFIYELEIAAIRDDWKQLISKESLFAVVCCICVVGGKVLAETLFHFDALDSSRGWTSVGNLWLNFGAVIQGFMILLQVLPITDHAVMSITGSLRVMILIVFCIIVIAVFSTAWRTRKNLTWKNGAVLFLLNIVLMNFLVFGLFNVRYGRYIFEERYLISTFFITVLIVALFFSELGRRRVLAGILSLAMALSIFLVDVHSDINYLRSTNDEWQLDEIQTLAEAQDAGVVYFWGEDLGMIARTMRACDLDRIYKTVSDYGDSFIHAFGDYTVYDNFEDYTGKSLLIVSKEKSLVPDKILTEYTLLSELDQLNASVYVCDHNPKLF